MGRSNDAAAFPPGSPQDALNRASPRAATLTARGFPDADTAWLG